MIIDDSRARSFDNLAILNYLLKCYRSKLKTALLNIVGPFRTFFEPEAKRISQKSTILFAVVADRAIPTLLICPSLWRFGGKMVRSLSFHL